jgi:rod shape-determining protein MreD
MKRSIFLFLTAITFFTLQATILASLPIQRIRPDLVLILVLYFGFSFSMITGGILAFFLGCLLDLFSGNSFGLFTFTRPLIFLVAQLFRNQFYWEGFSFQFLFVFTFALFEGLLILVLLAGVNPVALHNLYPSVLTHLIPQAICTALIAAPLFKLFNWGTAILLQRHRLDLKGEG